jgi:hypothetical protein
VRVDVFMAAKEYWGKPLEMTLSHTYNIHAVLYNTRRQK